MKIEDEIFFSPKCSWQSIDIDSKEHLIECYIDRIIGYYLDPAEELLKIDPSKYSFACGSLLLCAMDAMGRSITSFKGVKERINKLFELTPDEELSISSSVKDQFLRSINIHELRHGLVHEGLLRNGYLFTSNSNFNLIQEENGIAIVNVNYLIDITKAFIKCFKNELNSNKDSWFSFRNHFSEDFKKELKMFTPG
ncbi:MAG: hypothetical protein ABJG78_00425 [Cyclobacteriaceae bacterium]